MPKYLLKEICHLVGVFRRILVDAGDPDYPDYITNLKKVLADYKTSIQEIVLTHRHNDHIGGVPDVCREVTQCRHLNLVPTLNHFLTDVHALF